jgi:hypothetical protein
MVDDLPDHYIEARSIPDIFSNDLSMKAVVTPTAMDTFYPLRSNIRVIIIHIQG